MGREDLKIWKLVVSSWEQVDDPKRVIRKRKELDEFGKERVITMDLAESFFAELGDW